ncbi:hypothetical protein [Duganella callida]|uniref:Uncharacterized protein n=1 Tax=Duganella callida TaxID=2561932 RepID=A0A4Y9SEV6_9BURK|nr:hypothetical protein [Duganella callida]TFW19592.1 hypothetical protein E4L98_16070 [Duganella callida]
METDNVHTLYAGSERAEARKLLGSAETPIPLAPSVELPNGSCWIPQQYLLYHQTATTVSAILADIETVADVLLFSGHDEQGLYLQVGTLGPDNYRRRSGAGERRLVYGRKWRIESYKPTSEVIQTAFLAVKKACEHDVRELLTITDPATGRTGTPFSTHIDLPLMAHFPELVLHDQPPEASGIAHWLADIRFGQRPLLVEDITLRRNGSMLIDLRLSAARAGFEDVALTLLLAEHSRTALLHELMQALVSRSDRLIDEQFRYRGFARFSRALSPHRIAALSVITRSPEHRSAQFAQLRGELNYETDARRIPTLGDDRLADKNRALIGREAQLGGHMPAGLMDQPLTAEK